MNIHHQISNLQTKTKKLEASLRGEFLMEHSKNTQSILRVNHLVEEIKRDINILLSTPSQNKVAQLQLKGTIASVNVFLQKYRELQYHGIPLQGDLIALDISLYLKKHKQQLSSL